MATRWSTFKETVKSIRKREVYVLLSIALLLGLLVAAITDLVIYNITQETLRTTQAFTLCVLVLHCVGFYIATIGYVYMTQMAPKSTLAKAGSVSVVGNFLTFTARTVIELVYINYRPERYYTSSK